MSHQTNGKLPGEAQASPPSDQGPNPEGPDDTSIQENSITSVDSSATVPSDRLLSLKDSLGGHGIFGIVGASLWILGVFAFLVFLWFGYGPSPEAADATKFWRFIAMHSYFPRAITLSTLALRIAVSFQAGLCTSMLAALILEKRGVRRSHSAWLSVMRGINDGPRKLGELILSSKNRAVLLHPETWLTVLIIAVLLALQFSSTLLLSDLSNFRIIGNLNITQFPDLLLFNQDDFHLALTGLQFISQPPVYAVLGEAQPGFNTVPSANGVSDTGVIQRALVPLPEADARLSLRKLESTSIILSAQSTCIRPKITATYNAEVYSIDAADVFGYIIGTIDYKASFDAAGVKSNDLCSDDNGCANVAFECPIPSSTVGWATVTCIFDGAVEGNGPVNFDPVWDPLDGPWSRNTSISLVTTANLSFKDWLAVSNETELPGGRPYQEWQSYEIIPDRFVNISLCSSAFSLSRSHTIMTTPGSLREPRTELSLTSKKYNTKDVQSFMGAADPQGTHADRGILNLEILGPPDDGPPSSPAFETLYIEFIGGNLTVERLTTAVLESVMYYQLIPSFQPNISLSLCYFCTTNGYSVNPEISLLFNDIVTQTGRPANAFLSLTTTIFTSVYYTYLSTLQMPSNGQIVSTTTVQAPGPCSVSGCGGFISVTVLIFAHLSCVVLISILYVRKVRYSRLGQIWHTISQLVAKDLTDVLEVANHAGDGTVRGIMAKEGQNGHVKLGKQGIDGRVEVEKDE